MCSSLCELTKSYKWKDSIGNIYNQVNFLNEAVARIPVLKLYSPGDLSLQSLSPISSFCSPQVHD